MTSPWSTASHSGVRSSCASLVELHAVRLQWFLILILIQPTRAPPRGSGTSLIRAFEELMANQGVTQIFVDTQADNGQGLPYGWGPKSGLPRALSLEPDRGLFKLPWPRLYGLDQKSVVLAGPTSSLLGSICQTPPPRGGGRKV